MSEDNGNGSPGTSAPRVPAGDPGPIGFFGRLFLLFRRPSRLMDDIGRHPSWWQPLLLVLVTIVGFSWTVMPITVVEQADGMRTSVFSRFVPEEDLQEIVDESLALTPSKRAKQALIDGVVTIVLVVLFGLVLGLFAQLSGGQVRYDQALGLCTWSAVPVYVFGILAKVPLVFATESVRRPSIGLAALVPNADVGSLQFNVLYNFGDFFTWWGLALVVLGFRRVFGLPTMPAVLSVVLPWIIMLAFFVGIMVVMM